MVVFPTEEPIIENLNSYYLDPSKLLEHYQGQLDSGVIHFKSAVSEGAVFFDKDGLLEGVYESKEENLLGREAVERYRHATRSDNFTLGVYELQPGTIYYWTSVLNAENVYENLSTEFTDLEGLIRKMASEKLSGYIDISVLSSEDRSRIFFINGRSVGGAYSWETGRLDRSQENLRAVIRMAKERGAVFHVKRISSDRSQSPVPQTDIPPQQILEAMEELLVAAENLFQASKSARGDFRTLLKKSFLALAETYPFLDPFAGEIDYTDHRLRFTGEVGEARLAEGLLAAFKVLAEESGIQSEFKATVDRWLNNHGGKLKILGVTP